MPSLPRTDGSAQSVQELRLLRRQRSCSSERSEVSFICIRFLQSGGARYAPAFLRFPYFFFRQRGLLRTNAWLRIVCSGDLSHMIYIRRGFCGGAIYLFRRTCLKKIRKFAPRVNLQRKQRRRYLSREGKNGECVCFFAKKSRVAYFSACVCLTNLPSRWYNSNRNEKRQGAIVK